MRRTGPLRPAPVHNTDLGSTTWLTVTPPPAQRKPTTKKKKKANKPQVGNKSIVHENGCRWVLHSNWIFRGRCGGTCNSSFTDFLPKAHLKTKRRMPARTTKEKQTKCPLTGSKKTIFCAETTKSPDKEKRRWPRRTHDNLSSGSATPTVHTLYKQATNSAAKYIYV